MEKNIWSLVYIWCSDIEAMVTQTNHKIEIKVNLVFISSTYEIVQADK